MKSLSVIKSLPISQFILTVVFVMGLIYIYLAPPFQVPDSPNHFFRTYQLASGQLLPNTDNNTVGGWVPASFHHLQETFTPYRYNKYHKMEHSVMDSVSRIELNEENKVYMQFPNTGVYSPVSYIPQTIAMRIGLWLNMKPIYIYYLVRFFAFFFWFGMMVLTFRFLPIKKLLFGVLVLLPMCLFINTSFSADMMINGLSWLYLAIVLHLAFTDKKITIKWLIILLVLIAFIGLSKLVYIPIVGILLLIPFKKFQSKLKMAGFVVASVAIGFGSASLWKSQIDSFYTSYLNYNKDFRDNVTLGYQADMNKQIEHIKANKLETVEVFAQSYVREFVDMTTGYIGNLGWNRFRMPTWFIIISYLFIFFFAFTHVSDEFFLSVKQKLILIGVVGASTILVMLSQYLTWNPVGHNEVWPLMGRYFTPVYPMLFLLFTVKKAKVSALVSKVLLVTFGLLATFYTGAKMVDSFYVNSELELAWNEDFSNKSVDYLENEHVFEFGKINPHASEHLATEDSVQYQIKLNAENPFAYTISFFNVKKNDKISLEAYRSSDNVTFVFDDRPNSTYYTSTCHSTKQFADGFELIKESYFCLDNFEELKIYIYNPSGEEAVVKDFEVRYFKAR